MLQYLFFMDILRNTVNCLTCFPHTVHKSETKLHMQQWLYTTSMWNTGCEVIRRRWQVLTELTKCFIQMYIQLKTQRRFCVSSPLHRYTHSHCECVHTPSHWVRVACLGLHLCTLWVLRNSHLGGMTLSTSRHTIGCIWSDLALCMPRLAGDPMAVSPNLWRCCWDGVTACSYQSQCQGAGNREAGNHAQQAAGECLPV